MPSYGGNDAFRRTVEVPIKSNPEAVEELNRELDLSRARLEAMVRVGIDAGKSWAEIARETASARAAVNAVNAAVAEAARQLAAMNSAVDDSAARQARLG
jgi:hypothetical protein